MGWGQFKGMLSEVVVEALRPIQQRYGELMADPATLDHVLSRGRQQAEMVAQASLERVRTALGLTPRPPEIP